MRALFSALSLANFNLQLLAMDCYEGWGGLPRRLALQFTCPLLCLAIYGFLLLIYATLLFLGRVTTKGRDESLLAALVRIQRSPKLAHALDRTVGAYQALLYVMYPMLLINVISIFDCRPVDEYIGLEVLDAQPSIDCYSEVRVRVRVRARVRVRMRVRVSVSVRVRMRVRVRVRVRLTSPPPPRRPRSG